MKSAALIALLTAGTLFAGDKDAVVDVRKVFEKSDRMKDIVTQLEKDHEEKKAEITKLEKDIDATKAMLNDKTIGVKLRERLEAQLAGMIPTYEFIVKRWNESWTRRLKEAEAALYAEMQEIVGAYAKENGLGMVFEKGQDRSVIWAADDKEITAEVTKRMNEKFAKEKEAKAKEPPKDEAKAKDETPK